MSVKKVIDSIIKKGRSIEKSKAGDESMGPLKQLPGTWKNIPNLEGRGWNMIALPFSKGDHGYRLLVNQYNETLVFDTVDKGVPNRGIPLSTESENGDQFLSVLSYVQSIDQIAASDSPVSGLAGVSGLPIHHEPGLWLNMLNKATNHLNIARLGTIPHGDSILALGTSRALNGAPEVPVISGLPIGVNQDLSNPYLEPYKHFHDNLFEGLFDPVFPNHLLEEANQNVNIIRTTELAVNSTNESGGVLNIPFVKKQADVTEMQSTFWIQELDEKDASGNPKLRLQYTQTVFLEFFGRTDGVPGLIRWPHVSINTLEKVD